MSGAVQALIGSLKSAAAVTDPNWASVTLLLPGNGTNGAQNNTFLDASTNNFTITRNGNTTQGTFNPFTTTAPYSASVNGGSGFFDGTGDYLTVADNAALQMGAGDFTIEFWLYYTSITGYQTPYDKGYTNSGGLLLQTGNGNGRLIVYASGSAVITETGTASTGVWIHYALVRSGTTLTLYRDGTSSGTATNSTNFNNANQVGVGANGTAPGGGSIGQYPVRGYMSNLRVVKGTAVYTANFTPPTAPLTAITNTSLLLNFTNAGIIDNAMLNDLETVGNAQISTTQSKFGGSSIAFDGTGDNLTIQPANAGITLGSGDFTLEMWAYFNNFTNTPTLFDQRPAATNGAYPLLYIDASNQPIWYVSSAARITGSALSTSTWYHIVVARSGTSTKMFVDGVQVGSTYTDSTNYLNGFTAIGSASFAANYYLNGYIDDLRITKGVARYTANFTPPTAAFPLS